MAGPLKVVGGVDPHADTIHVAVITLTGKAVADREFATTADGYRSATAFLTATGAVVRVGVEGAASYGAGFTRALKAAGIDVVDVDRPARFDRRRAGKSDRLDAYHAARAVLAERSNPVKGPAIEGVRALHLARRSAVKAQTAAMNQMIAILVMAPDTVRARYRRLHGDRLAIALTRSRGALDPVSTDTLFALKALADRYRQLAVQVDALTTRLDHAVRQASPALRAAFGVGPDTAAQLLITAGSNPERLYSECSFAALCGSAPVQASSGKTHRHRLSRGGDRAANSALHRIALVRMANHRPAPTWPVRQRTDTANARSSACSSEPSPERSTGSSPIPPMCPTTPTSAPSGKPRTSPSPSPPGTSTSGPPSSPGSNAGCAATTTSPGNTEPGSRPPDHPRFRRQCQSGRSAGAVKMQRPTDERS